MNLGDVILKIDVVTSQSECATQKKENICAQEHLLTRVHEEAYPGKLFISAARA